MRRLPLAAGIVALALAVRSQIGPAAPVPIRAASASTQGRTPVERGRAVYERYGCALCHGAGGKGGFANPNSETAGQVPGVLYVAEGYTAAELRRKILDGVKAVGLSDAKGPRPPYRMPGWAGQMTDREVDDLVAYLLSLYPKPAAEEKWR